MELQLTESSHSVPGLPFV